MSASPYQNIGVASAFSPRFLQVLAEAKRMRDRFGAELNLIYVGKRDAETQRKFRDAIQKLELPHDSPIHYQEGEAAAAVLQVCAARNVELIVAGALEKEVVLRPFLGNVARTLVREARCSVMLFTQPADEPLPLRRIVFVADHSEHGRAALLKVLHLAAAEHCERLYVISVYTSFDEARAALRENSGARSLDEEERALEQFIDSAGPTEVPIEARCIRGNTGYAALDFLQSVEANLVAVAVNPAAKPGEFPPHIAWVADTIPCNLWVVR